MKILTLLLVFWGLAGTLHGTDAERSGIAALREDMG